MNPTYPASSAALARCATAPLLRREPLQASPPVIPGPSPLHHLHNRDGVVPPIVLAPSPIPSTEELIGAPAAQFETLSRMLAAGPVTLDLLHTILAAGNAGTPLACLLADELTSRCTLPSTMDADTQALWRDVLLHALRLPTAQWELAALPQRCRLQECDAQSHPLLAALRDALHRPCSMSRMQWQKVLADSPGRDSRTLALDLQKAQLGGADMSQREAWSRDQLQALAPGLDRNAEDAAWKAMRRSEQREGGLLDPRIGLRVLVESGRLEVAALGARSPLARAAGDTVPLPVPDNSAAITLARHFTEVARAATLAPVPTIQPLGRYDSVARALTSLLSVPGQLAGLQHWLGGGSSGAWVSLEECGPAVDSCEAPDHAQALEARNLVTRGLLGRRTPGTALARLGGCHANRHFISGLQREAAAQIAQFMRRQQPDVLTDDAVMRAYTHLLGKVPEPDAPMAAPAAEPPAASFFPMPWTPPRARAGALTDERAAAQAAHAAPAPLPGVGAQLFGGIPGHAPLLLLHGLIDEVRAGSWWRALPGYVERSPQGLLTGITDLFALAGVPLHNRPPSPDALERFFASPQGLALFDSIRQMPELADWQREQIERAGPDTHVYLFMRLLRQLMGRVHAHSHHRHPDDAPTQQAALHALARIGVAAGELLVQYNPEAPDAGRAYFKRALRMTRPKAAQAPTPLTPELIEQHARRVRPPLLGCAPVDTRELRQWLVDTPHPLLTLTTFERLSAADRCLAQLAVVVTRMLYGSPLDDWRSAQADAHDWRIQADTLAARDAGTPSWEAGVGVYFHVMASQLKAWLDLPAGPVRPQDLQDLYVYLRRLIQPLHELYALVEVPLQEADRHYTTASTVYQAFFNASGRAVSAVGANADERSQPVPRLLPSAWLASQSGHALAAVVCPPGAASLQDGLASVIQTALNMEDAVTDGGLPPIWSMIVHGPHALQQWLDSSEGRNATAQWMQALNDGTLDTQAPVDGEVGAQLLRSALLSQLPPGAHSSVPSAQNISAQFAHGSAPVLSLAVELTRHAPLLLRHPQHALLLAIALLPHTTPADPARLPLMFPLWPAVADTSAAPSQGNSTGVWDLLEAPERDVREWPAPPLLDTHALPPLQTLLSRFGLEVLQTAALNPADLWELMSRTQAFALLGQQLLRQTDWVGAEVRSPPSPQGARQLVAQALLQHYVGRAQMDVLRARLNAPDIVDRTFADMRREVHVTLKRRHPGTEAAAIGQLEWLLLRELDQPALLVTDVPDWLQPGSATGLLFLHGVALLEAMQPGASAHARFTMLCALPGQLAGPSAHVGDQNALHAAWARAMLRPAVLHAIAQGRLPGLNRVDAVTPEQARMALDLLQETHERQALNLDKITTPAPQRLQMAQRTLIAAGVDRAYWSRPFHELPAGLLAAHGIVPSSWLHAERGVVGLVSPGAGMVGGKEIDTLLTADDSLQMLLVADAYVWTNGPSTRTQYDAAFAVYQQRVTEGLAGLIEDLLRALPAADRAVLEQGTCTALQVTAFGQQARQGLLLKCEPANTGQPAVYFEVLPSAGLIRRAVDDARQGPWVDAQGLIDGSTPAVRDERLTPVSTLDLTASPYRITLGDVQSLHMVALSCAHLLLDDRMKQISEAELKRLTRYEALVAREKELLEDIAEFIIPFYACGRHLIQGDTSVGTLVGCGLDLIGGLVGYSARIVEAGGERTVNSLVAHTGDALLAFGRELAAQSGLTMLADLGRAALWLGSRGLDSALQAAGWLRTLLQRESELGTAARAVDDCVAHGAASTDLYDVLDDEAATLAIGRAGASPPALLIRGDGGWYRYDPIERAAYGPALNNVALHAPLPALLPTTSVQGGIRLQVGAATDARIFERSDGAWEVWIDGTPYLLDPADGSLYQREVHGGQTGEVQELDAQGCRVQRGVEAIPRPVTCVAPTRLRFVPDRLKALPDDPSTDQLGPYAFGFIEYQPVTLSLPGAPALVEGEEDTVLESLPLLWQETPLRIGPRTANEVAQVITHQGQACMWHTPLSRQGRRMPPKLAPLTPEEAEALGIPLQVSYLPHIQGYQRPGDTLGLPQPVNHAFRFVVNGYLPVIELGPIAAGINDSRKLRGVLMSVGGIPSIAVEVDRGVYYAAAVPQRPEDVLHFTPMQDNTDINRYLQRSELYRMHRENPEWQQLQRNIQEMAFNYLRPGMSEEQRKLYGTFDEYRRYCQQHGLHNSLNDFSEKVASGNREQKRFIELSRLLIPDWKALQGCSQQERQAVADILNKIMPLRGKESEWVPLTAECLAQPETGQRLLKHVNGANFAFLEVETTDGTFVFSSLSSGERAKKVQLTVPENTGTMTFIDAAKEKEAPSAMFSTLPVLRHDGDSRTIWFDRGGDSENVATRKFLQALKSDDPGIRIDPGQIRQIKLWSILGLCSTCGGLLMPRLKQELDAMGVQAGLSVRYLIDYVK